MAAAKRLRAGLSEARATVVVAVATAAVRDAANSAEVVERLDRAVGTDVRVLDGEEEARLCFLGQRAGVWTGAGPTWAWTSGVAASRSPWATTPR